MKTTQISLVELFSFLAMRVTTESKLKVCTWAQSWHRQHTAAVSSWCCRWQWLEFPTTQSRLSWPTFGTGLYRPGPLQTLKKKNNKEKKGNLLNQVGFEKVTEKICCFDHLIHELLELLTVVVSLGEMIRVLCMVILINRTVQQVFWVITHELSDSVQAKEFKMVF